jgi:hypothetical protein
MSHPITSHAPVVLRSRYVHLRAILAVALIAVVSLTVAVVLLATGDDVKHVTTTTRATTAAPLVVPTTPGARYDGGPDEGTRGPHAVPFDPGTRYDGGPEEGTRGVGR